MTLFNLTTSVKTLSPNKIAFSGPRVLAYNTGISGAGDTIYPITPSDCS